MAQSAGRGWRTIQEVIELFVMMGCEPREFLETDVEPFSEWKINYLYSPDNDCFVSLVGYDPDDRAAPSTIEAWERALGMQVPWRPPN